MQKTTSIQKGGKSIRDIETSLAETLHELRTAASSGKLNDMWETISWFKMSTVSTNDSKTQEGSVPGLIQIPKTNYL